MHLIGTIIIGFIIGAIAKLLMPGRDPGGWIISILLGLAGSAVGGWLGRVFGWYQPDEPAGFLMSVIGAVVLLWGYRLIAKPRSNP